MTPTTTETTTDQQTNTTLATQPAAVTPTVPEIARTAARLAIRRNGNGTGQSKRNGNGNGSRNAGRIASPAITRQTVSTPETFDVAALVSKHWDNAKKRLSFNAALDEARSLLGLAPKAELPSETFRAIRDAEKRFNADKLAAWHANARPGSLRLSQRDAATFDKQGSVADVARNRRSATKHDLSTQAQRNACEQQAVQLRVRFNAILLRYDNGKDSIPVPVTNEERAIVGAELAVMRARFASLRKFAGFKLSIAKLPEWAQTALDSAKVAGEKRAEQEAKVRREAKEGTGKALGVAREGASK